jgi:isopentenyl-diphosphate delta-isomerase
VIASGGIRGPRDVAHALALGADAVALALAFLRAYQEGEEPGVILAAERLIESLRVVTMLTGARRPSELQGAARVIGGDLRAWIGERA